MHILTLLSLLPLAVKMTVLPWADVAAAVRAPRAAVSVDEEARRERAPARARPLAVLGT